MREVEGSHTGSSSPGGLGGGAPLQNLRAHWLEALWCVQGRLDGTVSSLTSTCLVIDILSLL